VFISARAIGVEIRFTELSKGRLAHGNSTIDTTNIQADEQVLEIVEDIYNQENEREKIIFDKAKSLLPIISLAFAVLIAFRPALNNTKWLIIPIIFTLLSIIIIIRLLSLRVQTLISITDAEVKRNKDEIIKMRIKDMHNCATNNSYENDLLADIYKTSQTYLILGALAISIIVCYACFNNNSKDNSIKQEVVSIDSSLKNLNKLHLLDSILIEYQYIGKHIDSINTLLLNNYIRNDTVKTIILNSLPKDTVSYSKRK
jgi:hypothetical protein